jgi:hypothetical protein
MIPTAEWWAANTRVDEATGCRLAVRARPDGYKQVRVNGKAVLIHRLAFEQAYGPIAPGMNINHRCDTPSCCNPEHLYPGTQKDNLREMFAKGRARPRGKATAALTEFPAVSYRVLARERQSVARKNSNGRAQVVDIVHHIRPSVDLKDEGSRPDPYTARVATSERWKQVTGVPNVRPTQALVKWERPVSWAERLGVGIKTGVSVARNCASSLPSAVIGGGVA